MNYSFLKNSFDETGRHFLWFSNFPLHKNLFQSDNDRCPTATSTTACNIAVKTYYGRVSEAICRFDITRSSFTDDKI